MGAIASFIKSHQTILGMIEKAALDELLHLLKALSGWDAGELQQWGFDGDTLMNWQKDVGALGNLLQSEEAESADAEPQIDRAAELQEKWQVKPGDLWRIGEHRLACGDCREPETWGRLLAGAKANGVFTSPPYAEQRKEQYGGVPTAEYVAWWEAVQANVKANLAGDGSFFVNIKPHCEDGERALYVFDLVLAMKRQWGWQFVDELCCFSSSVNVSRSSKYLTIETQISTSFSSFPVPSASAKVLDLLSHLPLLK